MQEIELKFQIPPEQVAAVREAVQEAAQRIEPMALQAAYFDTADSLLARHRMALRVRREGADWVQTFKAAGQDTMTRVEDNQPARAPLDGRIRPDLALHTAPAVRQAMARAWGRADLDQATTADTLGLQALYETRFDRWSCQSRQPQGRVIVCVDIGEVVAGRLREPIREIEIELSQGQPLAVIEAARHWVDEHGVWLDVQSKAYRGTRLAQADRQGQSAAPAMAVPPTLGQSPDQAGGVDPGRILSLALDAAAGNWSEVAAARPGWEQALEAWRTTLHQLIALAGQHRALRDALTDHTWQTTRALADELTPPITQTQARTLACSPRTTHWGLDILGAIRR